MTNINDLQERINSAEAVLDVLKADLEDLKKQEQEQEQENLLGRWATHPENGRGIIISRKPDGDGEVRFAYRIGSFTDGVDTRFVRFDGLTLDPATLNTTDDFDKAPVGTIVEDIIVKDSKIPQDVYMKSGAVWYATGDTCGILSEGMTPCRVIRWGERKMTRKPDRESIPGYHTTTWAEWDFGDENKWQNVTRRKNGEITIYSADTGYITIPECEAPSLITALQAAIEWEETK